MKIKTKQFLILWSLGMTGVLSFLLIDLSALLESLPLPPETEIPMNLVLLAILNTVQVGALLLLAVFIGVKLAHKVGLFSPALDAAANGQPMLPKLYVQILPGIFGGLIGGAIIIFASHIWRPYLPSEVLAQIASLMKQLPLLTRLLYGGITEELFLRWGFLTLIVWVGWKLFQKRQEKPDSLIFVSAIFISSIVFGLGHFPLAFLVAPDADFALLSYVLVANSTFGLIAGYLYWKKGLEASIIAHIFTHVALFTAQKLGAYF